MKLWVNGKEKTIETEGLTLEALVKALNLSSKGLIIEKNGTLYREEHFSSTPLQTNDRLEIIHFMGGGA
jgi:sulfur carrier protein